MHLPRRFSALLLSVSLGAAFSACGGRGGGGSGSSDPCDRLIVQCESCANANAAAQCFQAVNLNIESTCQQLLDSGTYAANGVECTR